MAEIIASPTCTSENETVWLSDTFALPSRPSMLPAECRDVAVVYSTTDTASDALAPGAACRIDAGSCT